VAEYKKGDSAADEIEVIRLAFARAGDSMLASPDVAQSFADSTTLEQLGRQISTESAAFREWFVSELVDSRGISQRDAATILHISQQRVSQLVRAGRRRGNPVTNPATLPELPRVALAIITDPTKGVLVERRKDGIPLWTFPGGEMSADETTAAQTIIRRVTAEVGRTATPETLLGRRIHPRTGRTMIYVTASVDDGPLTVLDDDLDGAEWMSLDSVRNVMPDMFSPVREHLEAVLGGSVGNI
jgi:8-oxo-dGTP pyrophosphatase MutT (NUDIX family)